MLMSPSGSSLTSCLYLNSASGPNVKSEWLPPRVQTIFPVTVLILYTPHVSRMETSAVLAPTRSIELMWYASHGNPLPGGSECVSASPMCLYASQVDSSLPVLMSYSCRAESTRVPLYTPPHFDRFIGTFLLAVTQAWSPSMTIVCKVSTQPFAPCSVATVL